MKTCDTCKWWGMEKWKFIYDDNTRKICGHPKIFEGYNYDDSMDATDIHKTIDSSFVTGPKFGCVHHEEK